jgi:hypothetical protein
MDDSALKDKNGDGRLHTPDGNPAPDGRAKFLVCHRVVPPIPKSATAKTNISARPFCDYMLLFLPAAIDGFACLQGGV